MNILPTRTTFGEWIATHPAEIMIYDQIGIILEMSNVSIIIYEKEDGAKMIGRKVYPIVYSPWFPDCLRSPMDLTKKP